MWKKSVSLLVLLSLLAYGDATAQGLLKRLDQAIKKTVVESVGNKKKSGGKSTTDKKGNSSSRQTLHQNRTEESNQKKKEERKITFPQVTQYALFEPIGYPSVFGKVVYVCPEPPEPHLLDKIMPWWESIEYEAKYLTNESLVKEMDVIVPKMERSQKPDDGIHGRYNSVYAEFSSRAKAINDVMEYYSRLTDQSYPEASRVSYANMLAGFLCREEYKRALNSSITPLKPHLKEKTLKYIEEHGGLDSAHLNLTEWEPYQNDPVEVSVNGAAVGKLMVDATCVDVDGLTFKFYTKEASRAFKDNCVLIDVDESGLAGGDVVIPGYVMYKGKPYPVTELESYVFGGSEVKSVSIPTTVTKIGRGVFCNMPYLKTIEIPSGVREIGDFCFSNCTGLVEALIPDGVVKMGMKLFEGCSNIANVVLPKNLETIENRMFKDCRKLKSVTLPAKLKSIPDECFYNCVSLTAVSMPDSLISIGWSAFQNCRSLTSLVLPSKLESVGMSAFVNCTKLASIQFPPSITDYGTQIVKGCKSLKTVVMDTSYKDFYQLVRIFGGCEIFPNSYVNTAKIPPAFKFVDMK